MNDANYFWITEIKQKEFLLQIDETKEKLKELVDYLNGCSSRESFNYYSRKKIIEEKQKEITKRIDDLIKQL